MLQRESITPVQHMTSVKQAEKIGETIINNHIAYLDWRNDSSRPIHPARRQTFWRVPLS